MTEPSTTPPKPDESQPHSQKRALTREEQIAVHELKAFNPEAENINCWKNIPSFLGATLILLEYNDPEYNDCCVLVRANRGTLYNNWEDVMNLVSDYKPSLLSRLSSPQVVIMFLSLGIFLASCIEFLIKQDVPEPFRAALSAVVGYWLGQAIPTREGT